MNTKHVWAKVFILATITVLFLGFSPFAGAADIKIGALNDMTGATSDVGKDYALGIAEAIHYINDTGGINGKKIKLYQFDYGYRIPEALTKYNLFKRLKCAAILGWGTGDTEALAPTVAKDKIPYVSASYSGHLCDPTKTPYNLFFSTDYSTQSRGLITSWFDKKWPNNPDYGKRKPRIAMCYMFASPFSSSSIKAAKDQATILGFDIGPDQDVSLFAIDTKSQILSLKEFKPDVVLHTNTVMSVAATLRDAYALGLGADNLIKCWGFDENLPRLAGKAAEGAIGCAPWAFYGLDVKLMDKVVEYAKKYNPGIPQEKRTIHTVQAWANALGLAEALKRADKAGDLSGEGILKKGFETMKGFEVGLGVAPATFTPTDHRSQSEAKIYEYKNGAFTLIDAVDLKKRWPEKWEKEWLGW
ncbi:branched-chain amino acid ABC transporter substrate-binding protein [Desulfosarcina widdelii]|uniref:Branched-chain amino acid ABC transporter substrate-binding protein n=1 Tax=Desulfosarcina widdelii TaxID=947919 RepID=A0A5K7ZBQ2_9BACT|nr:ABC transporter substrate-binding protein [Desulfosarcina widdelii]BBO77161.1 branched-chain amino acid ABC transporter substrate-binding protein [Desulfosarcina widdelii]